MNFFENMAEEAGRRISMAELSHRIAIVQGDAHRMPFPDNAIGPMMSRVTIHHGADPLTVLQEIYRVMVVDGGSGAV